MMSAPADLVTATDSTDEVRASEIEDVSDAGFAG